MTVEMFQHEGAGLVNHARGYRWMLAAQNYGYEGVFDIGAGLLVTERGAGADMSVDIAAGDACISDENGGQYPFHNDGTLNVAITAADPTNDRITIIVAQEKDAQYADAGAEAKDVLAIDGTPAGSPSPPTLPPRALLLATVLVPATDTAIENGDITDERLPAGLARTGAKLRETSTVTMTNNVAAIIPFNVETYDYSDAAVIGASAAYTVPDTGLYHVSGGLVFGLNDARQRGLLMVYVNGVERDRLDDNTWSGPSTNDELGLSGSGDLALNAGDVVTWRFQPVAKVGSNDVQLFSARGTIRRVG